MRHQDGSQRRRLFPLLLCIHVMLRVHTTWIPAVFAGEREAMPIVPVSFGLEEAISVALDRSPRLQSARAASEAARWEQNEALSGFLPSFSVSADHYFNRKFQIYDFTFQGEPAHFPLVLPWTSLGLFVNFPIFNGLRNVKTYSAARLSRRAAGLESDWAAFQTEQGVRIQFYRAIAADLLDEVAAENVRNLEDHLRQVQDLIRAGEATRVDLLRVQVRLSNARSDQINADDEVLLSRRRLAQAMGLSEDGRRPSGELPKPSRGVLDRIEEQQVERRADIEALGLRSDAAAHLETAAGNYWIPSLNFVGDYVLYNNRNALAFEASDFRSAYDVGITLSWNLFDGLASYSRSKQSEARSVQALKAAEEARLQLPTDFETYRRRYRYNYGRYQARMEDLARSRESARLALVGLRSGTQTSTDVLDAELDLFRSRAAVIQAQLDAIEALIGFELSIGRRI